MTFVIAFTVFFCLLAIMATFHDNKPPVFVQYLIVISLAASVFVMLGCITVASVTCMP